MGSCSIWHPLTQSQESLLSKGPNYAVAPKAPNLEYITAIESVCQKLDQQDAEGLRAGINRVLRKSHAPKPNFTIGEIKALVELRKDSNRTNLTGDKGVAMVVVDRKDYTDKANNLLVQPAYRTIDRDPANKLKAKLITILRRIKRE